MRKSSLLFFLSFFVLCSLKAQVKLPEFFGDNMILQQKAKVKFWGSTALKSSVVSLTSSWDGKTYRTYSDDNGQWSVELKTPKFGGPYTITINDGQDVVLNNVLIGDVWFCSGQSNMEMPLAGWGKINNFQQEIDQAKFPEIRILQVTKNTSNLPITDFQTDNKGWNEVTPASIENFSSTAYFFAREVYKKTGVPIGLIHSSWGGTRIESWMSGDALKGFDKYKEVIDRISKPDAQQWYQQQLALWKENAEKQDSLNILNHGKWFENYDFTDWSKIQVPSFFDSKEYPNLDGVVYYSKEIQIPASMRNQELKLFLGAIDDNDETYVNHVKVGQSYGYNTKRVYSISAENNSSECMRIFIRVTDESGEGGLYVGDERIRIESESGEQISLAGLWDFKIGYDVANLPAKPQPVNGSSMPTALYNAMVKPFENFKIKGIIWYQGESNAEALADAKMYKDLFPVMISDWRAKWGDPKLPFIYAQLANYKQNSSFDKNSFWAILRDAQVQASKLPNTAMAVLVDIGNPLDIHPKNKQEVGRRLALLARKNVYKQKLVAQGPQVKKWKVLKDHIKITFDSNIQIKQLSDIPAFYGLDANKNAHTARVKVDKNSISLYFDTDAIEQVYYAWTDNPEYLIFNDQGLPASPFHIELK